jgi:adenosylmethionine-8-amino-7-oxononanoate aminotransferase
LELVSDQTQKTPIDKQTIQRLQTAAYKGGVMLRVSGPNVIFPLIIDEADTAQILQAVDRGFASL